MPLPLPNLDDRTYTDLVEEAQARLPALYPSWSNYNPSDPGIVLVELFAWLTEMTLYQVNQVSDENIETFLKLLNGPGWALKDDLDLAIQETMQRLRERNRAVTAQDFEDLILHKWPESDAAKEMGDAKIKRVHVVPNQDLSQANGAAQAPGHISLLIVPNDELITCTPNDPNSLCAAVHDFLDERRLLTTFHHVVLPTYVDVTIQATIHLKKEALIKETLQNATTKLETFYDPLTGGPDGDGWPFGRDVYLSEISAILAGNPYVNYVSDVTPAHTAVNEAQLVQATVELEAKLENQTYKWDGSSLKMKSQDGKTWTDLQAATI